jgi:hypothetical protein
MVNEPSHILEPENSQSVLEFLRVTYEYCVFAEKAGEKPKEELLDIFLKIGPLLYLKGKLLPQITPEHPEAAERFVTEEEWQEVFNQFRKILGEDDEFHHVGYEEYHEFEAVKASLSENFTDIYQDLKDFMLLYQKNTQAARQIAVHDCWLLFNERWGRKLLENLRYVHFLATKSRPTTNNSNY